MPPAAFDFDFPCIACGYNLRTRPIDAQCPECSRPITDTLANSPHFYDPEHLFRTLSSTRLMAVGNTVGLGGAIFCMIMAIPAGPQNSTCFALFAIIGVAIAMIANVVGARELTLPTYRADPFDPLLRASSILVTILFLADILLSFFPQNHGQFLPLRQIVLLIPAGIFISTSVYAFLLGRRLARLCQFAQLTRPAFWLRTTSIATGTTSALLALAFALLGINQWVDSVPLQTAANSIGLASLLAALLSVTAGTVALFRLHNQFQPLLATARQYYAATRPGPIPLAPIA